MKQDTDMNRRRFLGQAAGVAAAVSVEQGCRPRDVDVAKVQKVLKEQEAYLG